MTELQAALEADFLGFDATFTYRGAAALYLALKAVESTHGTGEIVVPATVCPDVPIAGLFAGFSPRFCDVDPATFCMTPETVAGALSDKTRAVIVVHLFGKSVPMPAILDLTRPRGIAVIEDLAQSIGGELDGRRLGSFGDLAILSFDNPKIIPGRGGLLLTRLREHTRVARRLQAGLDEPMDPTAAARESVEFNAFTRELSEGLRAEGLSRPVSSVFEKAARNRRFFVARPRPGSESDVTFLRGYRDLERQRALRWNSYRAYVARLAPSVRYVRFEPGEMCWRLPVLLQSHEQQTRVIHRIRAMGALVSDHYFPASLLFGDRSCGNALQIGLNAINLWVDERLNEALLPDVCDEINRVVAG